MMPLFEWLDSSAVRYWAVAWSFFAALLASALVGRDATEVATSRPSFRLLAHPMVFVCLVIFTLSAFRWPFWFAPADINPDEDQMLASAITLRHFPVFWKYVDGGSSGPLNAYLLVAASWLGIPLNYLGARIVATLLQAFSLLCVWALLRNFASECLSRLALLPGFCFWAFSSFHDFIQYSGEHLSIALIAGAALAGAHAMKMTASNRQQLLGFATCGLLAGMTPFAKLQLVPLAFSVVVFGAVGAWLRYRDFTRPLSSRWLALFAGGITFPILVAACIAVYGLWGQFDLAYIQANIRYMETGDLAVGHQPGRFLSFAFGTPGTGLLIGGSIAAALLFTWPATVTSTQSIRAWSLATWVGMAVSCFCVIKPGRELTHYLQIFVIPCCMLAGVHCAGAWKANRAGNWPTRTFITLLFLVLTVAPPVFFRAVQGHFYTGRIAEHRSRLISPEGRFLIERMRSGDTLTVWGWLPRLHIETQMPQGIRDGISERQLSNNALRNIFRDRYVYDIARRTPTWFLDSVGPTSFGFHNRELEGYESFEALASFLNTNYVFIAEINNVRIFRYRKAPDL